MITPWVFFFYVLFHRFPASAAEGFLPGTKVLAQHEFSLEKRYGNIFVNGVFRENILLTMAYMRKTVTSTPIDWSIVDKPFHWELALAPGETVAYHDIVLPKYKNAIPLTTVHFSGAEGFLSDGWLVGDGTCHLASLISWAAKDAGLAVEAPTNHNFATIPEVPRSEGVSIFSVKSNAASSALQNLYIQNNQASEVRFVFHYDGSSLRITVVKPIAGIASMVKAGTKL